MTDDDMMSRSDTTAPERIWLQTAGDYAGAYEAGIGTDAGVTWCDSATDERDDEYVRADVALAMVAAEREACAKLSDTVATYHAAESEKGGPGHGIEERMSAAAKSVGQAIRARTPADALAALEAVKQEQYVRGWDAAEKSIRAQEGAG